MARRRQGAAGAPAGFTEFVLGRSTSLFRTGVLLTRDPHAAQDLLQAALLKAWRSWERIEGNPEAYVRRIVLNEFLSSRERRWNQEHAAEVLPETSPHDRLRSGPADPAMTVSTELVLADAVSTLPPRQRAVVVLRYYHDLTEAETAELMGITVGTVKSQHSKALTALRISDHLAEEPTADTEPAPARGEKR